MELSKLFIYHINVNIVLLVVHLLSIIFAHLLSVTALLLSVVEGTDLGLVTSGAITIDSLVLVGVVEPLNCRMTFVAEQTIWTLLPSGFRVGVVRALHGLTVFWRIFEYLWWPSEVSHVVGVNATFGVV